jgi:hypothetical protein
MKKEIVLFAICLLALNVVFAQVGAANETENKSINAAAMEVRYEIVKQGYEITITAMDITINYLVNKGRNVSILETLKGQFSDEFNKLSTATDPSTFGKTVAEMHKIAAEFKKETARLAAPGERGEIRKLIKSAIDESEKLDEIKENITQKKLQLYKKLCTFNIERIEKFIEKLKERNASTTEIEEIQSKLDEMKNACVLSNETIETIKAKIEEEMINLCNQSKLMDRIKIKEIIRERLIEKLGETQLNKSKINETIQKLNEKIDALAEKCTKNAIEQSKKEIRAMIREIHTARVANRIENINKAVREMETRAVRATARINERAMEKAIEVVSKLENKGMNVSNVSEKLNIINSKIQNLSKECANVTDENREYCIKAIKDISNEMQSTRKEISVVSRKK